MWPFQRKTEAPADSGSRPAPAPVIRRDWSGLPPIQRLIGAHPLTAPSDRFSSDLATHHDPSVSTEPMGHQVSAEAPAGIVLALARPTTRNDGPAMISRPRVQRRAQSAVEESGEWDGDEAAPPATRPSPLPAATPPAAGIELPVVAPAPVAQRLTALSPDVEPMPVESAPRRSSIEPPLHLSTASRAEPADAPVSPPRLTLGQARRLGLGAPINRVPDRAVQRATSNTIEMPLAAHPAAAPEKVEGEPSRAEASVASPAEPTSAPRLGLPLAARESRQSPNSDPPPPTGKEISVHVPLQRATELAADAPPHGGTEALADVSVQPPRDISAEPLPLRPIVQRIPHADHSPEGPLNISAEGAPAPDAAQRTHRPEPAPEGPTQISVDIPPLALDPLPRPSSPRGEGDFGRPSSARGERVALAPLVGARSLRPTATLQRSTEAAPIDQQKSTSHTFGADLAGVRVDRAEQDDDPADRLTIQPFTQGHDTAVLSSRGAPELGPSRSLPPPALTRIAQPQRFSETRADHASSNGQHVESQVQSIAPIISRAPHLPLAPIQRAVAQTPLDRSAPGDSTSEVVQRGWLDSISSAIGTVPPSIAALGHEASGATAGQDGSPGVPGQASGPMLPPSTKTMPQESDMDDLANKLYDRIRTRLKTELLVARERAGMLTDWR